MDFQFLIGGCLPPTGYTFYDAAVATGIIVASPKIITCSQAVAWAMQLLSRTGRVCDNLPMRDT